MRGSRRLVVLVVAPTIFMAASDLARAGDAKTSDAEAPEITVRAARVQRALRTERWTNPIPYPGQEDASDIRYSRFHKLIGYRKPGDPRIEKESLRFTRDLVADLRDYLRVACRRSRCSDRVLGVARMAAAYLADRAPRYALLEQNKAYNNWNWGWTWKATGGGATFEAGCSQMRESKWAWCGLTFDVGGVGDDLELTYQARTRGSFAREDVAIEKKSSRHRGAPLGKIWFSDDAEDHKVWLVIGGLALAPPAPAVR